jgi:hypothetical protein
LSRARRQASAALLLPCVYASLLIVARNIDNLQL